MSDFTKYKLCPSWSFSELADLCCGLYPNSGRESFEELNWAQEMINRACLAGDLPFKEPIDAKSADRLYGHHRFFRPADATKWAIPLFPKFPKELHDLSKQIQADDINHFGRDCNEPPPNQSDQLRYLNQASRLFWSDNVDRDDKTTYPDTKVIFQWLRDKGFEQVRAEKATSIIRPTWADKGRPPKK